MKGADIIELKRSSWVLLKKKRLERVNFVSNTDSIVLLQTLRHADKYKNNSSPTFTTCVSAPDTFTTWSRPARKTPCLNKILSAHCHSVSGKETQFFLNWTKSGSKLARNIFSTAFYFTLPFSSPSLFALFQDNSDDRYFSEAHPVFYCFSSSSFDESALPATRLPLPAHLT